MSKNLSNVQKIFNVCRIISKAIFILSIIGAVACFVGFTALWGLHKVEVDGIEVVNILEEGGEPFVTMMFSICIAMLSCISGAIISKFAEIYFSNELEVGTPFTYSGAKELLTIGILSFALPTAVSIISGIAYTITKLYWPMLELEISGMSISIEVALIIVVISYVFRYGAELEEKAINNTEQN